MHFKRKNGKLYVHSIPGRYYMVVSSCLFCLFQEDCMWLCQAVCFVSERLYVVLSSCLFCVFQEDCMWLCQAVCFVYSRKTLCGCVKLSFSCIPGRLYVVMSEGRMSCTVLPTRCPDLQCGQVLPSVST